MRITGMTIDAGVNGRTLVLARTISGCRATADEKTVATLNRYNSDSDHYIAARNAAAWLYGLDRRGQAAATNSMVHELLTAMETVAGC